MPNEKKPLEIISVRVSAETLQRLPPPSLEGKRAEFIRAAIEEKLTRGEGKNAH